MCLGTGRCTNSFLRNVFGAHSSPTGIQAIKLEELERRLRGDVAGEAAAYGGRIMLHRELRVPSPPSPGHTPHTFRRVPPSPMRSIASSPVRLPEASS